MLNTLEKQKGGISRRDPKNPNILAQTSLCFPLAINLAYLPSLPGFVKSSLCSLSSLHICCSTQRSSASVIITLKCLFLKFLRSPNYWIQQSPLRFYSTGPFCRFCHYCLPPSLEQFLLYYLTLSWYPCPPPIFWNTLLFSFVDSFFSSPFKYLHDSPLPPCSPPCKPHSSLTVFCALQTFTSVSLARVSLLSPHISLPPR